MNFYTPDMDCIVINMHCMYVCFNYLVPPVIDGSVSARDILVDIHNKPFPLNFTCSIKKSSPTPNVVWLRNGIVINDGDVDASVSFSTHIYSTANGYNYTLSIISNNDTYQFVRDNIIGMYQCLISNEAGHVIINQRVLFKCKLNYTFTLMCINVEKIMYVYPSRHISVS